ncbi:MULTISPECIES: AzlC family ABC transporter permease [Aerococcus]|uniref:AzlC family ABC transporter permease n=2 Tax=Aerococcus TaxID=1375 RepID=A0A1E9PC00_9LACT|nr:MULTISPECIES: AzlC family ABC transporter permease [Aerococcus]KAA9238837.1 branched-chain amino acid ABC transporter permease [Aerococcus urinae]KAA9292619.1 branched-chain amino acid ABC transporter permease [Aerococcus mictus]KAA9299510.1 branched-chain amino acid ABC transporter permease [Aerococcus tenax]MBU5610266.1 AzlC family ABC transporter permease [Aerococcus urinae]MCY3034370.1 AzlC family ABC transporter permease [Aerococcus mictus]
MKEALKFAFPKTIPIMMGYLFLSLSFGLLATSSGIHSWLTILMSLLVYGGSIQFAGINVLLGAYDPFAAFMLAVMVNARHMFYGITMLESYQSLGWKKYYSIFALSDETFSLTASVRVPDHIDKSWVYFLISLLDQLYWIIGTVLGIFLGNFISFSLRGIEFILTALFVSIFVDQWQGSANHRPQILALATGLICLFIFGPNSFLIPAMLIIIAIFFFIFIREEEER